MAIMESISVALGAFNAARTAVVAATEANRAIDTADLKLKLADAMSALADVKMEAITIQARGEELEKLLALRGRVMYRAPAYWETREDGSTDGPFCQRCWDTTNKLIRLHTFGAYEMQRCFACDCKFDGPRSAALMNAESAEIRAQSMRGPQDY